MARLRGWGILFGGIDSASELGESMKIRVIVVALNPF